MNWVFVGGIAFALAMDAFAVALATGLALQRVSGRQLFRLAFHFGLFQFLMPIIGWAAGNAMAGYLGRFDHWAAFLLLSYVGLKMLKDAGKQENLRVQVDRTRGVTLVVLSLAVSIDALGVGLSFAFLDVPIVAPCIVVGIVTSALTACGMLFGAKLGPDWGKRAEIVGGLILIAIGMKILVSHLSA